MPLAPKGPGRPRVQLNHPLQNSAELINSRDKAESVKRSALPPQQAPFRQNKSAPSQNARKAPAPVMAPSPTQRYPTNERRSSNLQMLPSLKDSVRLHTNMVGLPILVDRQTGRKQRLWSDELAPNLVELQHGAAESNWKKSIGHEPLNYSRTDRRRRVSSRKHQKCDPPEKK